MPAAYQRCLSCGAFSPDAMACCPWCYSLDLRPCSCDGCNLRRAAEAQPPPAPEPVPELSDPTI
jgi:hypothetical protein